MVMQPYLRMEDVFISRLIMDGENSDVHRTSGSHVKNLRVSIRIIFLLYIFACTLYGSPCSNDASPPLIQHATNETIIQLMTF